MTGRISLEFISLDQKAIWNGASSCYTGKIVGYNADFFNYIWGSPIVIVPRLEFTFKHGLAVKRSLRNHLSIK